MTMFRSIRTSRTITSNIIRTSRTITSNKRALGEPCGVARLQLEVSEEQGSKCPGRSPGGTRFQESR